jgi:hypothetical protein
LEDVVWGIKGCVDPAPPWVVACFVHPRQLEIERFPIAIRFFLMAITACRKPKVY